MKYIYKTESYSIPPQLFFIPLKDTVIFPYVVVPLFFQSSEALTILNKIVLENNLIGCVGQRNPHLKDPQPKDLLSIGTVCKVIQLVKLPNKGMKLFVEGLSRVFLQNPTPEENYFRAEIKEIPEPKDKNLTTEVLVQSIRTLFKISLSTGRPLSEDILKTLDRIDHPGRLADLITLTLHLGLREQQEIFETIDPIERLRKVFQYFSQEIQTLSLRSNGLVSAMKEMGRFHRDPPRTHLRGQKEPSEEDLYTTEIQELREKVRSAGMPPKYEEIALKEIYRLERMNPISAEYTVSRTYLDYLITNALE